MIIFIYELSLYSEHTELIFSLEECFCCRITRLHYLRVVAGIDIILYYII